MKKNRQEGNASIASLASSSGPTDQPALATTLLNKLAQIPNILPTIWLLEQEAERQELLRLPILRRILCNRHTILSGPGSSRGPANQAAPTTAPPVTPATSAARTADATSWILELLHAKDVPQFQTTWQHERIVEYLEAISQLTIMDYVGVLVLPSGSKHSGSTLSQELLWEWRLLDATKISSSSMPLPFLSGGSDTDEDDNDLDQLQDWKEEFQEAQLELEQTLANLPRWIPYLFAMSNPRVERVVLLSSVQRALHQAVRRPFMIAQIFCDFVFHMALLLAARNLMLTESESDSEYYYNWYHFGSGSGQSETTTVTSTTNNNSSSSLGDRGMFFLLSFGPASVFYICVRLVADLFAFTQISWDLFLQNLGYRWTIVDIIAVVMILTSFVLDNQIQGNTNPAYFSFTAITLGILWLKVLGFLQVLNRKLAAYILAIFEMIMDVWQFILILLVMVFGFGDMFYTIYTIARQEAAEDVSDYDTVCPNFGDSSLAERIEGRDESPFCSSKRTPGYLGVYRLFVGDISVNDFDATALSTALFVLVTFLGIIMLLNMLIALVLESYEKSVGRSKSLFGRTRIALVAKSILLEEVLMTSASKSVNGFWGRFLNIMTRLCFAWVFLSIIGYLIGISLYLLIDRPTGLDSGEVLILVVGILTIFLLLYFITVVVVYHMKGLGILTPDLTIVRLMDVSFYYCFALPATFITLSLMCARKEYDEQYPAAQQHGNNPRDPHTMSKTDQQSRSFLLESRIGVLSAVVELERKLELAEQRRQKDVEEIKNLLLAQQQSQPNSQQSSSNS